MTEQEWLECTDPMPMLEFLEGKASERKLRLFAVASVRRVFHMLPEEHHRQPVSVAERYADGAATAEELASFSTVLFVDNPGAVITATSVELAYFVDEYPKSVQTAIHAALETANPNITFAPQWIGRTAAGAVAWNIVGHAKRASEAEVWASAWNASEATELSAQSDLLRDIIGNPFRPVTINPDWVAWNDGMVRKIAQPIYDERAFDRLPILADALEEAGCDNADILNHCRQTGEHVRGCWVVDLLLGKK